MNSICSQCYKFPCKHCFCCILHILITWNWQLIIWCFNIACELLFNSIFKTISIHIYPMCYLKICCLISMHFGNFQLFVCYMFFFNSIVVWEQTLSNFYSFQFLRCNLWARAWSIMVNVLFRDWTECVFCYCLMKSLVCVMSNSLRSHGLCLPACQAPLSMEFSR